MHRAVSSLAFVLPLLPLAACAIGCGSAGSAPAKPAGTSAAPDADASAAVPAPLAVLPDAHADAPPVSADRGSATSAGTDVRAANAFTFALHLKAREAGRNATFSGTSLRHALAAVAIGARGETSAELAHALALPADEGAIATAIGDEAKALLAAAPEGGALRVPTRVWIDDGFALAPTYVERTKALGATAESLPIRAKPDAARATINAWASAETNGKIPELVSRGAIDENSKLVVTNAVYLKARWVEPFPKAATKDAPFKVAGKKDANVPTMHVVTSVRHAATNGAQIVELHYDRTPLAMVLAIPDEADGLAHLEDTLAAETLERWTKELTVKRVALALPRFTFSSGGSLKKPLEALGMKRAFTNAADLSGIGTPKDGTKLRVSDVLQRTFVAVDEIGTEAAAATGVVMRTTALEMGQPLEVKVDRPFLFVIRDTKSGLVVFTGRVEDPRK